MLLTVLIASVFGLLIGSFLNVVIGRVPAGESISHPPSRCPSCLTPIGARDNIPVLGWLLLRGKARCCGTRISVRYPVVEASTALAFAGITAWVLARCADADWVLNGRAFPSIPAVLTLVTMLYLGAVSIVLALIDIDVKRLPYMIVLQAWAVVGIGLSAAALLADDRPAAIRLVIGAVGLWVLYRLLHLIYPAGMAYGDVRLSALIGGAAAWVGWGSFAIAAFSGFLLGGLGGALLMVAKGKGLKTQIPYGPYMLAGLWIGMLWGQQLAAGYLRVFGL